MRPRTALRVATTCTVAGAVVVVPEQHRIIDGHLSA
jgi:hypothetical protein